MSAHHLNPLAVWIVILPTAVVLAGCGPGKQVEPGDIPMTVTINSTAFAVGQPIPTRHTADGENLSPPLAWSNLPAGTRQLALVCDDPDAPSRKKPGPKPWVHWVIYNIPPTATGLPEGVSAAELPPEVPGAAQGANSWPSGDNIGYRRPAPPPGTGPHRYYFKLYALDAELNLPACLDKDQLLAETKGHILAKGQFMGTYRR